MVYRWGICGIGKISADFATGLVECPGATISAVAASSDKTRAEVFAQSYTEMQGGDSVTACSSYAELLKLADVDIVYVGSVNTTHFATAMACIEAGKHCVCEKPIGVNGHEAAALAAAARAKGVFLMEGMWTRFFPAVVKAKELVASGAIGRVVAVHADFGFVCGDDPSSRMFAPELAGGGLLDIGVYPIAMASLAYGGVAPTEVKASGTKHPTTGVDTSAGITALYDDPAAHPDLPNMPEGAPGLAVITYNLRGFTPEDCLFVGTKGRLCLKNAHTCQQLVLTTPAGRDSAATETVFDLPCAPPRAGYSYHYPGSEGFLHEITEVHTCLDAKMLESPNYSLKEMVNIAQTMDKVRADLGLVYPQDECKPLVPP